MLPKNRPPTPLGEMLLEEYLKPRGVTQVALAARMGVPIQQVNTIVNGKRGITAASTSQSSKYPTGRSISTARSTALAGPACSRATDPEIESDRT